MQKGRDFSEILRNAKLKATPKRLLLLNLLATQETPTSVSEIKKMLGKKADTVTVYRALEALTNAGITKRVDFHEPEARYEFVLGREHHHHLVCGNCGTVEDVADCHSKTLEGSVLKSSKKFAAIKGHALEFFGMCKSCVIN